MSAVAVQSDAAACGQVDATAKGALASELQETTACDGNLAGILDNAADVESRLKAIEVRTVVADRVYREGLGGPCEIERAIDHRECVHVAGAGRNRAREREDAAGIDRGISDAAVVIEYEAVEGVIADERQNAGCAKGDGVCRSDLTCSRGNEVASVDGNAASRNQTGSSDRKTATGVVNPAVEHSATRIAVVRVGECSSATIVIVDNQSNRRCPVVYDT